MKNDKMAVDVEEDVISELISIVILNNYVDDELYGNLREAVYVRKSDEIEINNNIYFVRYYCLENIITIKNIMKLDNTHEDGDFGFGELYIEVTDGEEIEKVLEKFEREG